MRPAAGDLPRFKVVPRAEPYTHADHHIIEDVRECGHRHHAQGS